MKCEKLIKELREVAIKHFEELANEKNFVTFMHRTVEEKYIHGGLGDRDSERLLCLDKKGWFVYTYEHEFGHTANYIHFDNKYDEVKKYVDDQYVEDFINGEKSSVYEVISFWEKYNDIAKEYKDELKPISIFNYGI